MTRTMETGRYRLDLCQRGQWEPTHSFHNSPEEAVGGEVRFLRGWCKEAAMPEPDKVADTLMEESLAVYDTELRRFAILGGFVLRSGGPVLKLMDLRSGLVREEAIA